MRGRHHAPRWCVYNILRVAQIRGDTATAYVRIGHNRKNRGMSFKSRRKKRSEPSESRRRNRSTLPKSRRKKRSEPSESRRRNRQFIYRGMKSHTDAQTQDLRGSGPMEGG